MMPTASAVVADIIEIAMGNSKNLFNGQTIKPRNESNLDDIDNLQSRFYIRLMVEDKPGGVAKYTKILGEYEISISGVLQHEGAGPDNRVPVVITTNSTVQKNMTAALEEVQQLDIISGKPVCIRIVDIPEDRD